MEPDDDQPPFQPPPPPPPSQHSLSHTSSSLLKDISNFKTPKRPPKTPNHKPNPNNFHSPGGPQFFTAIKETPKTASSFRRSCRPRPIPPPSSAATTTKTRLKAFQLEQSQSACKAKIKKEQSLKCLSRSLTAWLNFLFQNPRDCGCDLSVNGGGPEGLKVGVEPTWRNPKRFRDLAWKADVEVADLRKGFSKSMFVSLRKSLEDVCSLDDLVLRMKSCLSFDSCKEVFKIMIQVTKSIDEGRLKMKSHCPIVTDFGIKEKAVRTLMCYSPIWLRIGMFAIFGGDSLLSSSEEDVTSDQEMAFLKMMIEKQFFSHNGLAKSYAYNKNVEGLYRPGYYEALGNVILKRFLLLVIMLDRAKTQTSLSLKFGIDGVDGGSPLLFTMQSGIKSSCEVIQNVLSSDVMHGEGNLLSHLVILGYKVSYEQGLLLGYDFTVRDLFVDLQDGMRLCRAIQLLQHNPSILLKLSVPSDTPKKNLANCCVSLQYLRQAGVMLSDEDGLEITADDIAMGDKELTLSLLWNIFVHLQLPLLVNRTAIAVEVSKIRGVDADNLNTISPTPMEDLLGWIQAVCEKYNIKVDTPSSLVDGKAIWCLLDYYFRKELCCSCSRGLADSLEIRGGESVVSNTDCTDAVHNFMLSQKLIALLGNFPEVLQVGDLLEHKGATSDRSVIILLVFLSSELIVKRNMDQLNFHKLLGCNCQTPPKRYSNAARNIVNAAPATEREMDGHGTKEAAKKFKTIQAWWQDMAEKNSKCISKPATSDWQCFTTSQCTINIKKQNAAIVVQSHFRKLRDRRNYLRMMRAIRFVQTVVRAWLTVKHGYQLKKFNRGWGASEDRYKSSETFMRYCNFFADGHNFAKLKRSALVIQHAIRIWISQRPQLRIIASDKASTADEVNAAILIQKHIRGWIARSRHADGVSRVEKVSPVCHQTSLRDLQTKAAIKIQVSWKIFMVCRSLQKQHLAATKIQSRCRCWLLRTRFLALKQATITIQSDIRCQKCLRAFQQYRAATSSATIIQSYVRGWFTRHLVSRNKYLIIIVQSCCRGWLMRRQFLFQRAAAIKIQSVVRGWKCQKAFHSQLHAAIIIQRFIQGHVARCRLSASKLQRWWKSVMLIKLRTKSAITIQCHIRGWIARRKAAVERQHTIVIQSCWKGYLARKESKQLQDLRLRVKQSAANVDDSKRLINRLISALAELLSMKSVSGILHTCSTLDMATQHSQKCCEELVAAGAVCKLLKLIRSVSRSIPDQEVLKHALSTLRNLARYPHLIEVLIDCQGSVQTIFWELLRNKDGFMIAVEILKKICSCRKGREEIHKLPALLKRLHSLVEELRRKVSIEKRKGPHTARENTERRLKEASELLKLASKV